MWRLRRREEESCIFVGDLSFSTRVALDTTEEGPDRLFVRIVTAFVQIVTKILTGSDVYISFTFFAY